MAPPLLPVSMVPALVTEEDAAPSFEAQQRPDQQTVIGLPVHVLGHALPHKIRVDEISQRQLRAEQ
jgi:hypothetical protein